MKNTSERLYWFYIIDGRNGKDSEGEQMIKQFIGKGHKMDSLYIFTSSASLEEMHTFIKENKMKDFMYMLVDMTDNVTNETFKAIVNEDYYRPAEKLQKLFLEYKPSATTATEALDYASLQKKADEIFDQISAKGMKSLDPNQKQFLEDFSKGKFDKKSH